MQHNVCKLYHIFDITSQSFSLPDDMLSYVYTTIHLLSPLFMGLWGFFELLTVIISLLWKFLYNFYKHTTTHIYIWISGSQVCMCLSLVCTPEQFIFALRKLNFCKFKLFMPTSWNSNNQCTFFLPYLTRSFMKRTILWGKLALVGKKWKKYQSI